MGSLSHVPWPVFLPVDRSRPLRVLGDPLDVGGLLDGRPLDGSGTDEPAPTILRLPCGPAPTRELIDSLMPDGEPRGLVVWISARNEPAAFEETNDRALRYLSGRRSLWSPSASWAVPLRGAGKAEFARQLLLLPLAHRFVAPERRFLFRVEVLAPAEPAGEAWILALLRHLAENRIADVDADGLGRLDRTATGLTVGQLATRDGKRLALKIATDETYAAGLERETVHLGALRALPGLPQEIADLLPRVIGTGRFQGTAWRLETWLAGRSAAELMYRLRQRERVMDVASDWIGALHESSRGPARRPGEYARWARSTIARVSAKAGASDDEFARRLGDYLQSRLEHFKLPTVSGHGDYWIGNILRHPDSGKITGVVDWQHGDDQAPPLADLLQLLFTRKWWFSVYDHGRRVADFLSKRHRRDDRRRIREYLARLGVDPGATGLLTLLYWVHYLAEWEPTEGRKPGWYHRSYSKVREVLGNGFESRLDGLGSSLFETGNRREGRTS